MLGLAVRRPTPYIVPRLSGSVLCLGLALGMSASCEKAADSGKSATTPATAEGASPEGKAAGKAEAKEGSLDVRLEGEQKDEEERELDEDPAAEAVKRDPLKKAKPKQSAGAVLPGASPAPAPEKPALTSKDLASDDLSTLESELTRIEGEMRMAGVALPSVDALSGERPSGGFFEASVVPSDRPLDCKKACELTETICALADNICEMKTRHPGEERYELACERGQADCKFGRKACGGCEG